jgi:4-hydroxybenzoate polyprenyltransferase
MTGGVDGRSRGRVLPVAGGLARACHPLPAFAVTALTGLLAWSSGRGAVGCGLVVATVLSGQLFIGWYNDLLDRERDIAVGRRDKPLATGAVTATTVRNAAGAAVVVCVPLSLANGWLAGLIHLVMVGAGWAYDAGLKSTLFSAIPYAVCFGLLPAFVSYGAAPPGPPAPAVLGAAALLGIGAHLTNAVPDLAEDAATGVSGLPHRLGARASLLAAATAFVAGVALVVAGSPTPPALALGGVAVVLAVASVVTGARPSAGRPSRWPFRFALCIGAVGVVVLLLRGGVR